MCMKILTEMFVFRLRKREELGSSSVNIFKNKIDIYLRMAGYT